MTVYVDDMAAPYRPKHRPGRTYVMCHMIADSEDELHAMAAKIGVARKWFQGRPAHDPHYDIAKSKRALAIKLGAVAVSRRELAAMNMLRRWGQPMGDPVTAMQRMTESYRCTRSNSGRQHMLELGSKVKDRITGFSGIVTGRCQYLSGCSQALVSPSIGEDGAYKEPHWLDEQRLEVDVAAGVVALDNGPNPGFDKAPPKR